MCKVWNIVYTCPEENECSYERGSVYGSHCKVTNKDNQQGGDPCPGPGKEEIKRFRVNGPCPECSGIQNPHTAEQVVRSDGRHHWKKYRDSGTASKLKEDRSVVFTDFRKSLSYWRSNPEAYEHDMPEGLTLRTAVDNKGWSEYQNKYFNSRAAPLGNAYWNADKDQPWGKHRPKDIPPPPARHPDSVDPEVLPSPPATPGDDLAGSPPVNSYILPAPHLIYATPHLDPNMNQAIEYFVSSSSAPTQAGTSGYVYTPHGQASSAYSTPMQSGYVNYPPAQSSSTHSAPPSQSGYVNPPPTQSIYTIAEYHAPVNSHSWDEALLQPIDAHHRYLDREIRADPGFFGPTETGVGDPARLPPIQTPQTGSAYASSNPAPGGQAGGGLHIQYPPSQAGPSGYAYNPASGQGSMLPPPLPPSLGRADKRAQHGRI